MSSHKDILIRYSILFSSHLFSILTPLIIFPLMVSRLGDSDFGRVIFVQALITYFTVLVDYDFNLWGVREVAHGKDRKEIYNQVTQSKIQLFLISTVLYLVVGLVFFDKIQSIAVLLSGVWVLLSYALNPIWYFQAKENVWGMATVNIVSKAVFLIGSFFFVRSFETAWIYNTLIGLGLLVPGLLIFYRNFEWKKKSNDFKRGMDIFLSNFSILVYSNSSPFWLALFMPISAVTEFSVGEKIVFAARGFLGLYSQIIYPKICRDLSIGRSYIIFIVATFLAGVGIWLLSEEVAFFFLKYRKEEVVEIVRWMAFIPTVIVLNIYPYQWLLAHSFYQVTRNILFAGALIGFLLFPIGISLYGLWGAVLASLLVETIITISIIFTFLALRKTHVPAR